MMKNAWRGILLVATSRKYQIGLVLGSGAIIGSWVLPLTMFDRLVVITFVTVVLVLEGFNTVIEKLLDLIFPEYNRGVGAIKDMLAGTVLIGAVGAVLVGVLILVRILWL